MQKFTLSSAYILGLYTHAPSPNGFGVCGKAKEVFAAHVIKQKLTEPNKLLIKGSCAFFYNNRVKSRFLRWEASREYKLGLPNGYSSAYLAGWFDAAGRVGGWTEDVKSEKDKEKRGRNPKVVLSKGDAIDEHILTLLNFKFAKRKSMIRLEKPLAFIKFILPFSWNKDELHRILDTFLG